MVRATLLGLGTARHECEDLVQETLARVLGRGARGEAPPRRIAAYAREVARNLWRDLLRRRRRGGPSQAVPCGGLAELERYCMSRRDACADPVVVAARREERERIHRALGRLSPRHRRTLELVLLQGKSYAEASRHLGVSQGTIKSRVHYAVRSLRRLMAGDGSGEPSASSRRLVSRKPPVSRSNE